MAEGRLRPLVVGGISRGMALLARGLGRWRSVRAAGARAAAPVGAWILDAVTWSPGPKVLGVVPALGMVALGAWGLQWEVAWNYTPPERLREKAGAVAAASRSGEHDIAIVGTCMSEQQIHADIVAATLGEPWKIHNMGGRASGPIDWYMMVKNKLPEGTIEGLVVAWIRGDLTMNPSIWEGQTMDLAGWDDLPQLAGWSCDEPGCNLELALRKGSYAYRYRGFLANMFWQWTGAKPPPRGGNPQAPGTAAGTPDALQGAADPNGGRPGDNDAEKARVALAYLRQLLDLARERGIPVWFARMPERSDAPDGQSQMPQLKQQAIIDELIEAGGAKSLELPVLPVNAFIDDRHVNGYGVNVISKGLGRALRVSLGGPAEDPVVPEETAPDTIPYTPPGGVAPPVPTSLPGAPAAVPVAVPAPIPADDGGPLGPPIPANGVAPTAPAVAPAPPPAGYVAPPPPPPPGGPQGPPLPHG